MKKLLFVSPDRHEVKVGGKDVMLTNKEFELLCLLLRNKGIVLTRASDAHLLGTRPKQAYTRRQTHGPLPCEWLIPPHQPLTRHKNLPSKTQTQTP